MGNLMEQRRTLWIIAAVGIFLLVVLGAALILYSPTAHSTQTIAAIAPVEKPASNGWVSDPESSFQPQTASDQTYVQTTTPTPAETPAASAEPSSPDTTQGVTKVGDMTVIAQNATIYGLEKKYPADTAQDGSTMIDLNTLKTAPAVSSEVTPQNDISAKAIETVKQTARTEPVKKSVAKPVKKAVPKARVPKKKVAKETPKAAAKPAPKTVKRTATVTQFWVQAAAFTNKKSADDARTILDNNKIPADVFTYKDNKGRMFYRVRIGPYTTKSEAEYWRTRIVQIAEFKNTQSYVTSTSSASN
jgi:cell division protein FtsN